MEAGDGTALMTALARALIEPAQKGSGRGVDAGETRLCVGAEEFAEYSITLAREASRACRDGAGGEELGRKNERALLDVVRVRAKIIR